MKKRNLEVLDLTMPTEPFPLVRFVEVVSMTDGKLGRDFVTRAIREDPRFPPVAVGGNGLGSKRLWSRLKVLAYFEQLAEEGELWSSMEPLEATGSEP
jgi:hypothetical protein